MKHDPLVVIMVAVGCFIAVAAVTMWLATEADIPSETAVPVIILALLAGRLAARRKTSH